MHSADELEKAVRITPSSVWVALVAFAALLAPRRAALHGDNGGETRA